MDEDIKKNDIPEEETGEQENWADYGLEDPNASKPVAGSMAEFEEFEETGKTTNPTLDKLDYLHDLQLNVYIELGRTQMKIKDILELERGYVIELDKLASEPVDIFVNNKKIAEGEVVVIDKHFGIRIVNLVDTTKRVKGL